MSPSAPFCSVCSNRRVFNFILKNGFVSAHTAFNLRNNSIHSKHSKTSNLTEFIILLLARLSETAHYSGSPVCVGYPVLCMRSEPNFGCQI